MMTKYLLIGGAIVLMFLAGCAAKLFSSTKHLTDIYGIQNIATGKGLRPYNAYWWKENRLVLYEYNNWKCMTWKFRKVDEDTYQLENLSTGKTFEPNTSKSKGIDLWQQTVTENSKQQYWKFMKQSDSTYLIKQLDADLYLTASSAITNSNIQLLPLKGDETQLWKLNEQHPWQ